MSEHDTALRQALSAYAGATSGDALDAARLRSRILQSVRTPRRRSLRRLPFVLPLVAVLAASAAFAASQPTLRAAVRASFAAVLGDAWGPSRAPRPREQGPRAQPSGPQPSPPPAPAAGSPQSLEAQAPISVDALPLAPPAASSSARALAGTVRAAIEANAATPTPSAPDQGSADLDAYRSAHRRHFDGASPAAALAAWDRYLEDFPAGSFADDARFNRALCLIRLGRLAQARAALEPFASAPPGSYRKTEAASLLQGLGAAGLRSSK